MGKLIITRRKEWQNRARNFSIFIDNEKRDYITNGEIKELEIEPGKHNLLFKVDWCSSQKMEIEIPIEKAKTIEVSGFKLAKWIYPIFFILFGTFYIIKIFFSIQIDELVYLSIPLILIILYYLSFGRKKYIEIKEL